MGHATTAPSARAAKTRQCAGRTCYHISIVLHRCGGKTVSEPVSFAFVVRCGICNYQSVTASVHTASHSRSISSRHGVRAVSYVKGSRLRLHRNNSLIIGDGRRTTWLSGSCLLDAMRTKNNIRCMAAYKLCYSMEGCDSCQPRLMLSTRSIPHPVQSAKEDRPCAALREMVSVGRIPDKAYKGYNSMSVIDGKEMPW